MREHTEPSVKYRKINGDELTGLAVYKSGFGCQLAYVKDKKETRYDDPFSTNIIRFSKEVFLPRGYPDSVHPDYKSYQIWDTAQAFASTILGAFTTHSIMLGVGVGKSTASPLAAAVTWILKDGTGMVGRILFAWWNGPQLDAQCKKWRLFADVLNDAAMGIELLLPYFSEYSNILLCFSSGMKSLVGVAGGATRASITQHQALTNNLADVSAKDGSQETCVNLIASLFAVYMLSFQNASSHIAFWYIVLVTIHIYANYRAVRALCFSTFNEDRLAIVIMNYLTRSTILSPEEANEQESVSVFHKASKKLCGFDIVMGESLDEYFASGKLDDETASAVFEGFASFIKQAPELYSNGSGQEYHLVFPDVRSKKLYVAFRTDAEPKFLLLAYFKAFLQGIYLSMYSNPSSDLVQWAKKTSGPLSELANKLQNGELEKVATFEDFIRQHEFQWMKLLDTSGWATDSHLLSVGPYRWREHSH